MSIHLQHLLDSLGEFFFNIIGDIWSWSVYDAGHVFWFWAWPFIVMPAIFMRKHLHASATVFVWIGIALGLPPSGMPEHIVGISELSVSLGVLSLQCLWTWLEFLSLWLSPSAYRQQSWWQLNKSWLVFILAIVYAMHKVQKENEKKPKLNL